MAKELTDLFETVKKAAEEAERTPSEEDRCIDNLKLLKDFPVNCEVLVSTQVGRHLRQLTKHTNDKIKSSASEVVAIWKDIVVTETTKNNKINGAENDDSNGVKKKQMPRTNSVKKTEPKPSPKNAKSNEIKLRGSPAPEEVPRPNAPSAIKIENVKTLKTTRAANAEGEILHVEKKMKIENNTASSEPPKLGTLVYCNDTVRDKVREMLAEALCKVSEEVKDDRDLQDRVDESDPCRVAVLVETAMFERWGKSSGTNKAKYRSILFNIKDANNPDFRRKVLLGDFQPLAILELTADQMASKARQDQNERIKQRALFNSELGGAPQASTDQFTCGRCKKKQTTYYQMQTRSADEPMTTFVTCVNCNNRWKFC